MNFCKWFFGVVLLFLLFFIVPQTVVYFSKVKHKPLKSMFDDYIKKHNKPYKYNKTEYEMRFEHFKESLREINRLNEETLGPEECKAKYGLTYLSDLSKTEFQNLHLSDEKLKQFSKLHKNIHKYSDQLLKINQLNESNEDNKVYERRKRDIELPLGFDWRDKGVISPVQHQGVCGACWAFSTIHTIEAMAAIKSGKLETLSVQEVIDCARWGNAGCSGGDICLLLNWLQQTKTPLQREVEYPLRLMDGTCRLKANLTGVKLQDFSCKSMVGIENKLVEKIATYGPAAVAVNAISWQHYLSGVIQYHCSGRLIDLNHAVQIVGYNLSAQVPYYIVKNSWGKQFGEDGYLRIAIGDNLCGIANEVAAVSVLI